MNNVFAGQWFWVKLMTQNVDENICILFFETTKVKVIAASHNYPNPCCMFSSGGVYPVKSLFRIIYWKENSQGRINHLQCDKRCIWSKLITDSQIVYVSVSVPTTSVSSRTLLVQQQHTVLTQLWTLSSGRNIWTIEAQKGLIWSDISGNWILRILNKRLQVWLCCWY